MISLHFDLVAQSVGKICGNYPKDIRDNRLPQYRLRISATLDVGQL